jgi:mannose-6-phosphate isomerase-like protein (cupin superfamily)
LAEHGGATAPRHPHPLAGSLRKSRIDYGHGVHPFDINTARQRLGAGKGGYEVVHESAGLEIGVYVLVAPEADRQQPHEDDEVYVVLEGSGVLEVEGESVPVAEGSAVFVEAGADHRFTAYEHLSVLVIFERKAAGNP